MEEYSLSKDTMRSNDTVAAYRRRDPERFPVACGTVEPLHGARSLGEIERMKHECGWTANGEAFRISRRCDTGNEFPFPKRPESLDSSSAIEYIRANLVGAMPRSIRTRRSSTQCPMVNRNV
jgi:hypothetical protein